MPRNSFREQVENIVYIFGIPASKIEAHNPMSYTKIIWKFPQDFDIQNLHSGVKDDNIDYIVLA